MVTEDILHSDRARPVAGPRWLFGRVAQGLLFSLTIPLDAIQEWIYEGVRARLAGEGPVEADEYVARDRGIFKGAAEARAAWALRATKWLDTWRRAGSPFAALSNVWAYFSPGLPTVRLVTDSGHWYTIGADGIESVLPVSQRPPAVVSNWQWDTQRIRKCKRVWVIIHLPAGYLAGFDYDSPATWDSAAIWDGIGAANLADLYNIAVRWLPAHALFGGLIVTALQPTDDIPGHPGVHPFDPTSASTTNADGSTNLPVENWDSPIWTSGASIGLPARPAWALFYNVNSW